MLYRVLEITPQMLQEFSLPSPSGEGLGVRLLPQWRRAQALRFKHLQGQLECVLSYLLLQQLLEEEFGFRCEEPFAFGEHGKPYLPSHSEVHFNLSHCKEAVACVVSKDSEVGIDVESRGRYSDSLADYVLNADELALVQQSEDPDLAFTRLWTQKEALLKAQGTGLTDNLKDILTTKKNSQFSILNFQFDTYVLSVAYSI